MLQRNLGSPIFEKQAQLHNSHLQQHYNGAFFVHQCSNHFSFIHQLGFDAVILMKSDLIEICTVTAQAMIQIFILVIVNHLRALKGKSTKPTLGDQPGGLPVFP